MSGDEERLLSLFRSTDNRGRSHILVIAEAEAKHAARCLCASYNKTLAGEAYDFTSKEEKGGNEG